MGVNAGVSMQSPPRDTSTTDAHTPTVLTSHPRWPALVLGALVLLGVSTGTVSAQSAIGDVYCGTGVETGIDLLFGALLGLGLPASILYIGKSGLDYMRAGGNPERVQMARNQLVMSGVGFGLLVLALISPGLIDKVGSAIGFTFSSCVQPF